MYVKVILTLSSNSTAEVENAEEECINDDTPCQKCGKYDKPEWVCIFLFTALISKLELISSFSNNFYLIIGVKSNYMVIIYIEIFFIEYISLSSFTALVRKSAIKTSIST